MPPLRRSYRYRSPNSRGYTLLDILIVLVALGLIAAVLFPVYIPAQAKAHRETCVNNLRHLSQAALQYAQDHDDYPVPASITYPRAIPGVTWYRTQVYWPMLLRSYVKDTSAFWCPAAPFEPVPFGPNLEWKTYGINAHVSVRFPGRPGLSIHPLSAIASPQETGYLVDSSGVCCLYVEEFWQDPSRGYASLGYDRPSRATFPAHDGGINIVFVDGHLDWIAASDYVGNEELGRRLWGSPAP